jgi:hypothetical protein
MSFIVRRKDPPVYEGAKTFWITVGHRDTEEEAKQLKATLKKFSKPGTAFWYGEENKEEKNNGNPYDKGSASVS